jgi:long-chain fatty acid transport protein
VPFGLKTEYDPAWVGRFQGIKAEIKTLNVNPALSWKATDNLALGFGADYQIGKLRLLSGVNYKGLVAATPLDPIVAVNAEGQNHVDVHGHAWGYNLGALGDLGPSTRLGIGYRSSVKYHLHGTTSFTGVPAAFTLSPGLTGGTADGPVTLSIRTPDSLAASVAHDVNQQWTVLAGAIWMGWSKIQSAPFVRDTGATAGSVNLLLKDTTRYAVGANYHMSGAWTLKIGVTFDQSPVRNAQTRTVQLPDNDRTILSFGAKYRLSSSGAVDFGYTYVNIKSTRIDNIQNNPAAGQVNGNVIGSYKSVAHIMGVQYAHSF